MRGELIKLREVMKENGIDWYIIPTTDFHGSENVHGYFKCREYVCGFTGSAGTLVVGSDQALLWTDGRYFLQAEQELEGSGVGLMKDGEEDTPSIPAFLSEQLNSDGSSVIGMDGRLISAQAAEAYAGLNAKLVWDIDLVGQIWDKRPAFSGISTYKMNADSAGKTHEEKLAEIRSEMEKKGADWLILTNLDEIAWTWNERGSDIENTPVFYAFEMISPSQEILYAKKDGNYDDFYAGLTSIEAGQTAWIDRSSASLAICQAMDPQVQIIDELTPAQRLKAIKNDKEIAATKLAHQRDGSCMCNFLHWVKTRVAEGEDVTEVKAGDFIYSQRMKSDAFDESFPTISAYGPNAAVVHYQASWKHDTKLKAKGFLLLDSGGQYDDGTTDITRTVSLGSLSRKEKEVYTLVLKSHIALASAVFAPGTTCRELDAIARKPLNDAGYDYKHGTGHGVGHVLCVHEGPNSINKHCEEPMLPGMITTDEPGVYIEGRFGVRLENELLCVEKDGSYAFQPITYCPFDRDAIDVSMLTQEEIDWINSYHKMVNDTLSPILYAEIREWVEEQTAPL